MLFRSTKSIFDGIEKSGLIVNDAQVTRLIIEEFYDTKNPRFELELFGESTYAMKYSIVERNEKQQPINYDLPSNKKNTIGSNLNKTKPVTSNNSTSKLVCEICGKSVPKDECISANKGKSSLCKHCFKKLF